MKAVPGLAFLLWAVIAGIIGVQAQDECTLSNLVISVLSSNVTANARTTVLIACAARGVSEPSITWELNDITISNDTSERHIIREQNVTHRYHDQFVFSMLQICQVEFDDAGEYLCTMTDGNCTVSATQPIWLTVEPEIVSIDMITESGKGVERQSTLLLYCVAYGFPVAPNVTWQLNGTSIHGNEVKHNITEWHIDSRFGDQYTESILQICNVNHRDSGEYSCIASTRTTTIMGPPINITVLPEIVNIDIISPNTTVYGQSTVLLYCVAYGFPVAPSITWEFDGTSILHDNETYIIYERQIYSRFGDHYTESILQLCHVKYSDSGEYICSASGLTAIVADPPIYLTVLPEIVDVNMISPSTTVYGQSTILLYCVTYGLPAAPSITWQFSGNGTSILYDVDQQNHTHVNVTERHVDGKYGEQYTESILQLCGVSHMDSGEYLCVASSGATTVTDPPIYLTVLPENVTINFITPSVVTSLTSTVLLHCSAQGYPTAPSLTWQFNGTSIPHYQFCQHTHVLYKRQVSGRYGDQFSESTLQICDARYRDSGEYICVARSGLTTIRAPPTILTVLPETVRIDIVTSNVTVESGSAVYLLCVVHGYPLPATVSWQFNGTSITNNTSCQRTVHERTVRSRYNDLFTESILKICNVGPEDSGDYLCSARSGIVSVSAPRATKLTVLHNEVCSYNSSDVSIMVSAPGDPVDANSSVRLVCTASGDPAPDISWTLDDTTFSNCTSERLAIFEYNMTTEDGINYKESALEIFNVQPEDSGEYLCSARYGHCTDSGTNATQLMVTLPPTEATEEPSNVTILVTTSNGVVNTRSTAFLVCVAMGSSAHPTIMWMFNESHIYNDSSCRHVIYEERTRSELGLPITQSILEICQIGFDDSGDYTCLASSGAATVTPINPTRIIVVAGEDSYEAEPPLLEFFIRNGVEDQPVMMHLIAYPSFDSTSLITNLVIRVTQIPTNATLSRGFTDGRTWNLTSADFGEMHLYLPEHAHGSFVMTVEAIDPVAEGSTVLSRQFTVTPVPDAPTLSIDRDPCICSSIYQFRVNSALVDTDGSEILRITIAGLPDRVQLSAGQKSSNGHYTLYTQDISHILMVDFMNENLDSLIMIIYAEATETSNSAKAVNSMPIVIPLCSTTTPTAPVFRTSMGSVLSCPRLEFFTSPYSLHAVQPGSCVAIRPQGTFEVQLIADSGSSEVSITEIQNSQPWPYGVEMGNLTRISNSNSYYVNVTWAPLASQWNGTILFCFSAVRSNGLPIDESCIDILPGYNPPAPIPSTAVPNQQLLYPSNTTWHIAFDSDIERPSVHAYITFHEYSTQVEVYRIDVSVSQEVTFSPAREITITPSFSFAEQIRFYIALNRGVVNSVADDFCGPGNEPITDKNFWTFETRDTTPPRINFLVNRSVTNTNVTIRWESNEIVTFECTLVNGNIESVVNCSEGYWMGYDLSAGSYVFQIQARDLAGNIGTHRHSFEVDLTPPMTTILARPASISNQHTSTLTFSCNEICTFYCQLMRNSSMEELSSSSCNRGSFITPALQPNTNYTFLVTATDQVGNVGETIAYSWETDYEAPSISIVQNSSTITPALCNSATPQYTGQPQTTDNRPEAITLSHRDAYMGCLVSRTWSATDQAGNVAYINQSISVTAFPLTVSLVSPLMLPCNSSASTQQVTSSTAAAVNPCEPPLPQNLSFQDSVSDYSCPDTFVRNWTVTSCGSSKTDSQTIVLYDLCPIHACGRNETIPRGSCSLGECFCNRPWYGDNCEILIHEPRVGEVTDRVLVEAERYSVRITLLQGTPPLTWIITSGPHDMHVNQSSGEVTWNRAKVGNYSITLIIQNQVGEAQVSWQLQVTPGYTAILDPIVSNAFPRAQPLTLTGHVQYKTSSVERALAGVVPVDVDITLNYYTRTIRGYTTSNGSFSVIFNPAPLEYGRYMAGARHPGLDMMIPQTEWQVLGMSAVQRNIYLFGEAFNGLLNKTFASVTTIINDGSGSLSGLSAYPQLPSTRGITIDTFLRGSPTNNNVTLVPGEQSIMDIRIVASRLLRGSFLVVVESAEGTRLQLVVTLRIEAVQPSFQIQPTRLTSRIVRGIPRTFAFNVTNVGRNVATNVRATLPISRFVSLVSFGNVQNGESLSLESGESAVLSILAQTPANQQLGEINLMIVISSSEIHSSIPVTLTVSSNLLMNFTVTVEDEYTYFAGGRPLVDDAVIRLINYQRGIRTTQTTDIGNGTTTFINIYEDRYEMYVEAPGHQSIRQVIVTSLNEPTLTVFLPRQAVRYRWSVRPVAVQDIYVIPVVAQFETHVPIPVVTVTPTEINLDDLESGALTSVQLNVTNHGLIRADNVTIQVPNHPTLVFSVNNDQLGDLEPLSSVIVSMHSTRRSVQKRSSNSSSECEWPIYYVGFDYVYVCNDPQYRHVSVVIKRIGVPRDQLSCAVSSISRGGRRGSGGARGSTQPGSRPPSVTGGLVEVSGTTPPDPGTDIFDGIESETPSLCDPCKAAVFDCILSTFSLFSLIPYSGCIPLLLEGVNPFTAWQNASHWLECIIPYKLLTFVLCLARNDAFNLCSMPTSPELPAGSFAGASTSPELPTSSSAGASTSPELPTGSGAGASTTPDLPTGSGAQASTTPELPTGSGAEASTTPDLPTGSSAGVSIGPGMPVVESLLPNLANAIYPIQQSIALGMEILGDSQWILSGDSQWLSQVLRPTMDDDSDEGVMISESELAAILAAPPPNGTTVQMVQRMVERLNNTITGWNNGQLEPLSDSGSNMASYRAVQEFSRNIAESNNAAVRGGFSSYLDFYNRIVGEIIVVNDLESEIGVCAVIRIRILQELALTREAFQARLEIDNQEVSPLRQIQVEIVITDTETGDRATNRFSIGNGTQSGSLTVADDGWLLPSSLSGSIEWLLIPYSEAAPESEHVYDIGGSFSYVVGSETIMVPLSPTPITVQPDPSLLVHYFLESRVLGDDPFTEVVEPSIPFTLGVAVKNAGYGTAYNLQITSGQPEIFDNEKDLLINFMIIGATLGNMDSSSSLTVMFGDITPNTTVVARWYMVSSLQGEFTSYSATFENRNPLGDPKLSLLDELRTHKLVKNVMMYSPEEDDGVLDFLVNDRYDSSAYPDALYSSRTLQQYNVTVGSIHSISVSSDNESTLVSIEATCTATGWIYFRYEDTQGILRQTAASLNVTKLERNQSITIPPENSWITVDQDPMTEAETFYLHIVDYIYTTSTFVYNTELCAMDCPVVELPIKLPTPNITISAPSVLYAKIGKSLQMECHVHIDSNITLSSNFTVSLTWFRGLNPIFNSTDGDVTISPISDSQLPFISTLTINPLNTTENDYFTCRAGVVPFSGIDSLVASDFDEDRVLVIVEEATTSDFTEMTTSQVTENVDNVNENTTGVPTVENTEKTIDTTGTNLKFIIWIVVSVAGGLILFILVLFIIICCCCCYTCIKRQQQKQIPLNGVVNILATEYDSMFEMTEAGSITMIDEADSDEDMDDEKKDYTFI